MLLLGLVFLSVAFTVCLSCVILLRNSRSSVYRWLSLFFVAASLWSLATNLIGLIKTEDLPLWLARLSFVFAIVMAYAMWRFVLVFTKKKLNTATTYLAGTVAALSVVVSLSPFVVSKVHADLVSGTYFAERLPLSLVVDTAIVVFAAAAFYVLYKTTRQSNSEVDRVRNKLILFGLGQAIILGAVTNAILPNLTGSLLPSQFSFIPISVMAIMVTYAIIRHRFLDVRLVVTRSIAYTLLLTSLVFIYAVLFFGLSSILLDNEKVSISYTAANVVIAVVLAFTFPYLKRFYDKLTDRIFYKDAYDSQELMNGINHVLVSTPRLRPMLERASGLIKDTLKVTACMIVVREPETGKQMMVGTSHKPLSTSEIDGLFASLDQTKQFRIDDLAPDDESWGLMSSRGFTLVSRLGSKYGANHQGVLGFVALGEKLSGNNLSKMDEETVGVITGELAIAVQSAFHFEQIQSFNATLQQRVGDETRKLRQVNEKLRQLDETKDDFISMASHQLRTPLTSVKGYLSMVLEGDTGRINATQRKMLEQAYTSSQRMVYLIADLLNASRLKTGKFAIEAAPVDLAEVVASEMDQLKQAAKAKEIDLKYTGPKQLPKLALDEMKTRQAIMNFVDNAIYYTPSGGKISVELTETNYAIELRVIDNGIGVPANERHHMFTKFYRAKNAQKARPDGTGLGLFMAKKVIVAEGGSVIFDSEEGKGSTFGFSFPKSKTAA